jgi:hypothetical protein
MIVLVLAAALAAQADSALLSEILRVTKPLEAPRGDRLGLFLWPAHRLGTTDEAEVAETLRRLDARGMVAIATWKPNDPAALDEALRLGRLQKKAGLPITVNATASTYGFFNGDPETAHVDVEGRRFFDDSFHTRRKMGCPFAIDHRIPEMVGRIRRGVQAYREAGLVIDFLFADWEVDGPIEWNGAWESSKRCKRCRRHIPGIADFRVFQAALRIKRAELLRRMLSEPVLEAFPEALVGNYGVYPHDGHRYWYDYFEDDAGSPVREWYPEFAETGLNVAMPVTYPWYRGYAWYDFESSDYRWFYNMLLVGTNAARSTPPEIPIITFVHWHTTDPPPSADPAVKQLGAGRFQELLWHLLLRGHDALFSWSPREEALEESRLVHDVYRESHAYREFLLEGEPVTFQVPPRPGPVVSALRRGERLLVLRSDFDERDDPVFLDVDGERVEVRRTDGRPHVEILTDPRR